MRRKKAVLILHGFSGALCDNEYLMNYLELDRHFDVYAWTLKGHDQPRIKHVTYHDWIKDGKNQMEWLIGHGYHKIYVIGHSMGGLLASYLASEYKEVKKLVLLSAAFDLTILKHPLDKHILRSQKNILWKLTKVPITTGFELLNFIKRHKNVIEKVSCPVLILQAENDHLVPKSTAYFIYEHLKSKKKTITIIDHASHKMLCGNRKEEISEYIYHYLKGGRTWKKISKLTL